MPGCVWQRESGSWAAALHRVVFEKRGRGAGFAVSLRSWGKAQSRRARIRAAPWQLADVNEALKTLQELRPNFLLKEFAITGGDCLPGKVFLLGRLAALHQFQPELVF